MYININIVWKLFYVNIVQSNKIKHRCFVYGAIYSYFCETFGTQGSADKFDSHGTLLGSNDIFLKWDIMWNLTNLILPLGMVEVGNVR